MSSFLKKAALRLILGGEAPSDTPKNRGITYSDELFTFQAKHSMMNSKKKHISSIKLLKMDKSNRSQLLMDGSNKDSQETHLEELRRHHLSSTMMLKNFTTKLIIKITGTFASRCRQCRHSRAGFEHTLIKAEIDPSTGMPKWKIVSGFCSCPLTQT